MQATYYYSASRNAGCHKRVDDGALEQHRNREKSICRRSKSISFSVLVAVTFRVKRVTILTQTKRLHLARPNRNLYHQIPKALYTKAWAPIYLRASLIYSPRISAGSIWCHGAFVVTLEGSADILGDGTSPVARRRGEAEGNWGKDAFLSLSLLVSLCLFILLSVSVCLSIYLSELALSLYLSIPVSRSLSLALSVPLSVPGPIIYCWPTLFIGQYLNIEIDVDARNGKRSDLGLSVLEWMPLADQKRHVALRWRKPTMDLADWSTNTRVGLNRKLWIYTSNCSH